jgi:hypothetical protein
MKSKDNRRRTVDLMMFGTTLGGLIVLLGVILTRVALDRAAHVPV